MVSEKQKRGYRYTRSLKHGHLLAERFSGSSLAHVRPIVTVGIRRKWFVRPQLDRDLLHERHEHVRHLLEPRNSELVYEFSTSCLKHVKDIPRILHKIRTVCSSVSDWYNLYQVQNCAKHITCAHYPVDIAKRCKDKRTVQWVKVRAYLC